MPSSDDRLLFDVWFSSFHLPTLLVACDLDIFEELARRPAGPDELTQRLSLSGRAVEIVLAMMASLGFLAKHGGKYHLTDTTRCYLLRASPFYWGPCCLRCVKPYHITQCFSLP
jgi:hypothetical protein